MAGKSYKFNHSTLSYEKLRKPLKPRLRRFLRLSLVLFLVVVALSFAYSSMFVTPKMRRMEVERRELVEKYYLLSERIAADTRVAEELKYRDNSVYRALFGADTLDIAGIYNPYPDERYARMDIYPYSGVMTGTWKSLDALTRQVYLRSKSLDDLELLALDKEKMALHIPAIWPIDRNSLKSAIGRFNMRRLHPILKYVRPHRGVDMAADRGTAVYATADGIVKSVGRMSGYGNQILIDHGYGYQTRYAHLSTYSVQGGNIVRRGELIGRIGSTGTSTSPHLHYEVIYRGTHVDPIMYLRSDTSEEEFRNIIESAQDTTYESDIESGE